MIAVGSSVRYSDYALQPSRDYWQGLGREPQKSRAKDAYDRKRAMRGTVTEIIEVDNSGGNGPGAGYVVEWADGTTSRCLRYMVEEIAGGGK